MEDAPLSLHRRTSPLQIPSLLQNLFKVKEVKERQEPLEEGIQELFSHLDENWILKFDPSDSPLPSSPLRIGVVLSGGPAPGGHNVVAGLFDAIGEWHQGSRLFGFLGGPQGLIRNQFKELTRADIDRVRNTGGFDLLGSGRAKIDTDEEITTIIRTIEDHFLDGLVLIGGDDTNTDAAFLAEGCRRLGRKTCIIGVPKTIDGDLQSADIHMSFGFDTACKVYSETIGNVAKDMVSTKKYYFFVKLMGRVASHVALECALQTHPNLAFISEEVAARAHSLRDLVVEVADLIEERSRHGKQYGLILVPEGLIENIVEVQQLIAELDMLFAPTNKESAAIHACMTPADRYDMVSSLLSEGSRSCLKFFPRSMAETFLLERDPHGNVPISKIQTERWLAMLVEKEVQRRGVHSEEAIPFSWQTLFCGYEGRSAYPSSFDCQYSYGLGRVAALLVALGLNGYMAGLRGLHKPVLEWEPVAVPLATLLRFEPREGRMKPVIRRTLVDIEGPTFQSFAQQRASWRLDDCFVQPGPIQYWGPDELVNTPCRSISDFLTS